MTFRQANERGGQVRRGERGTPVVLVKRLDPKGKEHQPDETATARPRAMLRTFTVFNVGQIDGLETDVATVPVPEPLPERLECARAFRSAEHTSELQSLMRIS